VHTIVHASSGAVTDRCALFTLGSVCPLRFRFNGALDTSKSYPKSGSLDDCALLRPVGADRSKHYNDLMATVNGFRRDFVSQQRVAGHAKEAYRRVSNRLSL
jgi:hypothetical protein